MIDTPSDMQSDIKQTIKSMMVRPNINNETKNLNEINGAKVWWLDVKQTIEQKIRLNSMAQKIWWSDVKKQPNIKKSNEINGPKIWWSDVKKEYNKNSSEINGTQTWWSDVKQAFRRNEKFNWNKCPLTYLNWCMWVFEASSESVPEIEKLVGQQEAVVLQGIG